MELFNSSSYDTELREIDRLIRKVEDPEVAVQLREHIQKVVTLIEPVFQSHFQLHPEQRPNPQGIEELIGPAGMV